MVTPYVELTKDGLAGKDRLFSTFSVGVGLRRWHTAFIPDDL